MRASAPKLRTQSVRCGGFVYATLVRKEYLSSLNALSEPARAVLGYHHDRNDDQDDGGG